MTNTDLEVLLPILGANIGGGGGTHSYIIVNIEL